MVTPKESVLVLSPSTARFDRFLNLVLHYLGMRIDDSSFEGDSSRGNEYGIEHSGGTTYGVTDTSRRQLIVSNPVTISSVFTS